MEKNAKAEEAVKKWLEENGYDYEVRTYMPGRDTEKCVRRIRTQSPFLPGWKMWIHSWSSL